MELSGERLGFFQGSYLKALVGCFVEGAEAFDK